MSTGIQNKMYNYEVIPPESIWQNITIDLDEAALKNTFPSTLHNIEITPPPSAWKNIENTLDEAFLENKYAEKLIGIESNPPAFVWANVKTALDAEKEEIATTPVRSISPFLKYAVAAAIVGLLAWGGIRLLNNEPGNTEMAGQPPTEQNNNAVIPNNNLPAPINTAEKNIADNYSLEDARNDAALEASKKTFAKLDKTPNTKLSIAKDFYFNPNLSTANTRGLEEGDYYPAPALKSASRYITLMTPDGNIIRMSKKLGDLVCCVSGEEQDEKCLKQVKSWQQKLADSPAAHSPGNFMDILSLVNSLQNNNEL